MPVQRFMVSSLPRFSGRVVCLTRRLPAPACGAVKPWSDRTRAATRSAGLDGSAAWVPTMQPMAGTRPAPDRAADTDDVQVPQAGIALNYLSGVDLVSGRRSSVPRMGAHHGEVKPGVFAVVLVLGWSSPPRRRPRALTTPTKPLRNAPWTRATPTVTASTARAIHGDVAHRSRLVRQAQVGYRPLRRAPGRGGGVSPR